MTNTQRKPTFAEFQELIFLTQGQSILPSEEYKRVSEALRTSQIVVLDRQDGSKQAYVNSTKLGINANFELGVDRSKELDELQEVTLEDALKHL